MKLKILLLSAAAATLFANCAHAQIGTSPTAQPPAGTLGFKRDRNVAVGQRSLPDYSAAGGRIGSFRLDASALLSAGYIDNLFATNTNTASDAVFHVAPSAYLSSVWSRHAVGVYANADIAQYGKYNSENFEAWTVGGLGRLDFGGQANVGANVSFGERVESRASFSSPTGATRPVNYSLNQGEITLSKTINRLRVSGAAALRDYDFDDIPDAAGREIDQDFRDQLTRTLSARADYGLSPDTALFAQVTNDNRNFDLSPPSVALDRDSSTTSVLGGANFELSSLLRGEIGVGYLWAKRDDARLKDADGFSARAELEYFLSPVATVTLSGSRSFQDSGIAGSGGYISSVVNGRVDYELRRNIVLTARAGYERNKFLDITRRDKRPSFGLSANYLLNRRVGVNLAYDYVKQRSSGQFNGRNFVVNAITLGATLRY